MLYAYNAYQPIISLLEQDIKDIAHGSAEGIIEHTRARYIEAYNRTRQQHFLLPVILHWNLTFLQKLADSPSSCAEEEVWSFEGRLLVSPCQGVLCRQVEAGDGGAGQAHHGRRLAHRCSRPSGWSRSSSAASSPSSPVSPSSSSPCTAELPCC